MSARFSIADTAFALDDRLRAGGGLSEDGENHIQYLEIAEKNARRSMM